MKNIFLLLILVLFFSCRKDKETNVTKCSDWTNTEFLPDNMLGYVKVKGISFGTNSIYIFANTENYYHGGIILRSTNNGEDWVNIRSGYYNFSGPTSVFGLTGDTVITTMYGTTSGFQKFSVSYNGGANWTAKSLGNIFEYEKSLCLSFSNSNYGFVGTDKGLLKTIDGGDSWNAPSDMVDKEIVAINMISSNLIYLIGDNICYKTIDSGQTWQPIFDDLSVNINQISFFDSLNGIIGGIGGLYKTNDGGVTWSQIYSNKVICTTYKDGATIYIVNGDNDILFSSDSGLNWEVSCNDNINNTVVKFNSTNGYAGAKRSNDYVNNQPVSTPIIIMKN